MKFKNIDWQSVSHIATSVAVVLALAVFVWQVKVNREERKFSLLLKYMDMYEKLTDKTESDWDKIKVAIRNNPVTKYEIPDRCSSLDYLKQKEGASRLFSIPRYDALMNHNVESFFGE
ncbi:MAG TPA: hypothetical protein ACFYEK_10190 [Candidatus Wunengus sp. YC60]|uniref:hypothetical protein n=1 Tax=Candidatus Wunengus sp. YC60 TaxID=3367697 RepID=UPI0040269046